jgi:hypothetical protein
MRDDFEFAMRLQGYKQFDRKGDHYRYDDIDALWQGFKLGRDSLVIEMPPVEERGEPDIFGNPGKWVKTTAGYRDACLKAIHAAGVKTR